MINSPANRGEIDRRRSPRHFCSLEAFVLPGPHFCTVVDRSETGLRLRFRRNYDGGAKLVIVLIASGQAFAASTRWSKGVEVGALIASQCDLNGFVPSTFAEARQVWSRMKGSGGPRSLGSNDP
jgi:hypothetical protein